MAVLQFKHLPIGMPARWPGATAELFSYNYGKWSQVTKVTKWEKGNMEEWKTNKVCMNEWVTTVGNCGSLPGEGFWGTV